MPILHVRNVPARLYRRIQATATRGRRSLSAEVILLLHEAIARGDDEASSRVAALKRIRARAESIRLPKNWPGSLALLHEGRRR